MPLRGKVDQRFLAVNKLGPKSEQNAVSGFKACGIVPFNPQVVLEKMAYRKAPAEGADDSWTSVLVAHLDELKTGGNSAPKRGKKVAVIAGKSITSGDLEKKEAPVSTNGKKRKRQLSSSSEEDDFANDAKDGNEIATNGVEVEDLEAESPCYTYEIGEPSNQCENTNSDISKPNQFVLVKFGTNKRDRHFIAKILVVEESEVTVSSLRKTSSKKEFVFVYPQIADISTISRAQIVKKITLTSSSRGRFIFHIQKEDENILE